MAATVVPFVAVAEIAGAVGAHVEGLDLAGVARNDHRLLEVLLHQVALVLALQVDAPFHGELELLLLVGLAAQQDLDRVGVGDAFEGVVQYELQTVDEAELAALLLGLGGLFFLQPRIQENEVVHAVAQHTSDEVLAQTFGQVHIAREVHEGGLGLDHPELRQVACGVAVLGAEGGAEGVDLAQRQCRKFSLQLSAHGQAGFSTEEVFLEIHFTSLVQRRVLCIQGAHAEHLACAFRIARRDDRAVEVVVALLVEVLVDAEAHLVADAEDGAVGVGAEAQVGVLAQELEAVLLRLDGILLRIAVAEHFHGGHLHFHALAAALALHDHSGAFHRSAGGEAGTRGGIHMLLVDHALQVTDGAAIVHGDEAVVAEGAHPAGHGEGGASEGGVVEDLLDGGHGSDDQLVGRAGIGITYD